MAEDTNENLGSSDGSLGTETYAQYSFRLARERRLQKEAIEREAAEQKRQRAERRKEELRKERELRKQVSPDLLALAGITKEQFREATIKQKAKAAEIENRREARMCISCGDDRDITPSGHCEQCRDELKYGKIKPPGVSDRQLQSAMCRVVRKGTEMS